MLHPSTLILLESGELITVNDINIGDVIQTSIGPTTIISKKEYSEVPLCKVMITGLDSIYCSPSDTFFMTKEENGYNFKNPESGNYIVYFKNDIMELVLIDKVHVLANTDILISLKTTYTYNLLVGGHIITKA